MNHRIYPRRASVPTVLIAVAIVCVLASHGAQAGVTNKAAAQALLREGNALLQQGQAADALEKFLEARRLFPSPKIYYNIGQAYGVMPGHEAQTYEAMSQFLIEAKDASAELRKAAEAQRRASRPKVGLVFVTADPPDANVLVDGSDTGPPSADGPLVLSIGTHLLALRKDAATSAAETTTVAGGETFKLQLRLPPPPVVVAPAPPVVAPPPPPVVAPAPTSSEAVATAIATPSPPPTAAEAPAASAWSWQGVTGASLLGLGAASLAFGVIEHVRYFGKADDFKNAGCGTDNLGVGQGCAGLKSQFDSARTLFIAGYVGAAVLAGAGTYLLWIAPTTSSGATDNRSGASVSSGWTAGFQGRF